MPEEKQKNLMTLREFKMWLQGVEEMQPDDWSPDSNQWAKIREKINQLDDTPVQETINNSQSFYPESRYAEPSQLNQTFQSTVAIPPIPPVIAPPPNRAFMTGTGQPAQAPAIDTSNGQYNSLFA